MTEAEQAAQTEPPESQTEKVESRSVLIWSDAPLAPYRSRYRVNSWRDLQAKDIQINAALKAELAWCDADQGVSELRASLDPNHPAELYLKVALLPTAEEMEWLTKVARITAEFRDEELSELPKLRIIDGWDLRRLGCITEFMVGWQSNPVLMQRSKALKTFERLLTPLSREFSAADALGISAPLVGGAYHPSMLGDRWITIVGERPLPERAAFTAAHEFAHALQDQRTVWKLEHSFVGDSSDATSASQWLVEGEATVLTSEVGQSNAMVSLMDELEWGGDVELSRRNSYFANALRYNRLVRSRSGESPYSGGSRFIEAIRHEAGWETIDSLFENPPRTMEQIIHPDKFKQREAQINLSELSRLSGVVGGGWSTRNVNRMGESFLRQFLQETLSERSPHANLASKGWGSDQLTVWTSRTDPEQALAVWQLVFDGEADHSEAWAPMQLWLATHSEGEAREALGLPVVGWDGPAGFVRLLQQGESIWLLAASDRALADDLTLAILDFPQTPYWSHG